MDTAGGFAHQALLYTSTEEFVVAAVPFIQSGLARSECVFVMTDPPKLAC